MTTLSLFVLIVMLVIGLGMGWLWGYNSRFNEETRIANQYLENVKRGKFD